MKSLLLALFLVIILPVNALDRDDMCPFCDEEVINRQKFYEDDTIIALFSHKPLSKGHVLIIPKEHKFRFEELCEEEFIAIHRMIRRVHKVSQKHFGADSYLLLQKNGANVGQTVPHVHFHYIPRKAHETSQIGFIFRFYAQFWQSPMSADKMAKMTKIMSTYVQEEIGLENKSFS